MSSLTSELKWESGQTYEFEYKGRMLTGLPELSTHFTGMGLQAKVILQVQSASKFAMQITDAKFTRVNEVLRYVLLDPVCVPTCLAGFLVCKWYSSLHNLSLIHI